MVWRAGLSNCRCVAIHQVRLLFYDAQSHLGQIRVWYMELFIYGFFPVYQLEKRMSFHFAGAIFA
jgi:hypothetical protein